MRLGPGVRRLLRVQAGEPVESDVDAELAFHVESRVEELVRAGEAPVAARARALREFGDLAAARAELTALSRARAGHARRAQWRDALAQDVRFALRAMWRQPAFTAIAVATLALGVGANAAIFSVVDAVLLRALPYPEPHRLVSVWPDGAVMAGVFKIIREEATTFTPAGYSIEYEVSMTGAGEPARLTALEVTGEFFPVLGARPALGRLFGHGDDRPGHDRLAVLSHSLWRQRFGGDGRVLGRAIVVDGVTRTIVGVAPPDFRFPSPNGDLWLPASFDPTLVGKYWGTGQLRLLARLRPGVERGAARAEAAAIIDRARSAFPWRMPDAWGTGVDVVPLQERVVGGVGPTLLVLLGGVGVVLLIACVNVANLFLGRAEAREREIAIRAAIGAGRGRVVRQLLTESVILALAGAAAGLALAGGTLRALLHLLPPEVPRVAAIGVDGRVLAFTTVLALATGIAFGLAPALRASRPDLRAALATGGRTGTGERRRLSEALVVAQVALAVVLVASAGLLLKSFWRLRGESLGFRAEQVVVAEVPVPAFPRDTTPRARAFYLEVLDRMRAIPDVRAAAFASEVPFGGRGSMRSSFAAFVEAHPTAPNDVPPMLVRTVVTPEFFDALDIPLRRGRTFTAEDRAGATAVAVVDEYTAKRLWPTEDPLGQRVRRIWRDNDWITVVGVVGDVKRDSLSSAGETVIYLPLSQEPFDFVGSMYAVARTDLPAGVLAPRLRAAVAAVDADVPVAGVAPLSRLVAESAARPRFTAILLASFAGLALVLGAVGIYGVISYAVARRTREIGVRVALGAGTGDVLRMVLRQGGALAGMGLAAGLVAALATGRALSGLLYGVAPSDPAVLVGVAAVLGAVALAASFIPARRAAAVDPLVAMRAD